MKKLLIIVLAVVMLMALSVFTACKKGPKGDSSSDEITSTEKSVEETSEITSEDTSEDTSEATSEETSSGAGTEEPVITAYDAPTVTASADGIAITHDEATAFKYKVDDGEWTEGASVDFSETLGEHTVTAVALADDDHLESDETTYTYEVKATALTINKTSPSAGTIEYVGAKLQRLEGEEFVDCDQLEYDVTTSVSYTFKACAGFDTDEDVLYVGETVKVFDFVLNADEAYVIEDFTDISPSILQSEWDIKKYTDSNTWEACKATITAGTSYSGSECGVLNFWDNGTKFRYAKTFAATDGYNKVSFDIKGNGNSKLDLSLKDSNTGIYIEMQTGTISNAWLHYEIAMSDTNWKINYGGSKYNLADAIAMMGSSVGVTSTDEVISFCDTISFIVYGYSDNGSNATAYIDNIKFTYEENAESTVEQPLFALGSYYVPTSSVEGYPTFAMRITDNGQSAELSSVDLDNNVTFDMSVAINGSVLTLTEKNSADPLTITGTFGENGKVVTLNNATGAFSQYVNTTIKYAVAANLLIDFEDGTKGSQYSSSLWTQEKLYDDTGWHTTTGQMNCREKNDSKAVNMATANGTTGRFTYNKGGVSFGLANYFEVDFGNDFANGAAPIKLKVYLTDSSNHNVYVMGGTDSFETFPVAPMTHLALKLDTPVNLVSFTVIIENKSGMNQYLYTDNFSATYTFTDPTEPEQPQEPEDPQEPAKADLTIDFEDGAGSGTYANSMWTQYKWDNSAYVSVSGKMNSRSNGSKIANMYGGWTTYKFIYNEGGESLGLANTFSARVGNYYVADKTIKIRVALEATDGTMTYLYGGEGFFYDMPYTGANTMITVDKTFDDIEVKSILVFVRYESGDNYLYIDDITLSYVEAE